MQILRRFTTRWLVIILLGICAACICAGLYLRAIRRPISPLIQATEKSHEIHSPIYRTFSPAQKGHVLDGDFLIVKKVDRIPDDLKSAFSRLAGMHDFEMANPGEKFQVADVVVEPVLPRRRLLIAGISTGKYFIHYEEGGRGHSYLVAVFTIDPERKVTFLWGGPGFRGASDLNQLRTMVAAGAFMDDHAYSW
jgi:hypothetical protein